jgi:hypothetical protein
MTFRERFVSAAACAVLLIGAAVFPGATRRGPKSVPFEVIERGNDSAFADEGPVLDLLPDEEKYDAFYAALHMNKIPAKAPPPVDFGSKFVLYVSYGRKQTGGYAIRVINVRTLRRSLVVKAQLKKPLPDGYLTRMITNPYVLLSVPGAGTAGVRYDRVELRDLTGDLLFTLTFRPW